MAWRGRRELIVRHVVSVVDEVHRYCCSEQAHRTTLSPHAGYTASSADGLRSTLTISRSAQYSLLLPYPPPDRHETSRGGPALDRSGSLECKDKDCILDGYCGAHDIEFSYSCTVTVPGLASLNDFNASAIE